MGKTAILAVKIVGDGREARREIDQTAGRLDKLKGTVQRAAVPAAAVIGGIGAAAKKFGDFAAEAEQNAGAVETVFKSSAGKMHEHAAAAAESAGLSASAYEGLASRIGGALSQAGFSQAQLGQKTHELISASADLSSVFGGDVAEAAAAMGGALRGEFDPLERFGVFLNMTAVNAELARNGQSKLTGAALEAAKKQTIHNMILQQAGKYQGNFAKEANTAAGAQARANAKWEDAQAKLGQGLLPFITAAADKFASLSVWVSQNVGVVAAFVAVVATVAAVVLAANAAVAVYSAAVTIGSGVLKAAAAAQAVFNAVMAMNPIALVVIAIVALIAVVILCYKKFDWFRNFVDTVARGIGSAFAAASAWVSRTVGALASWVGQKWAAISAGAGAMASKVQAFFAGIGRKASEIAGAISGTFSRGWDALVSGARNVAGRIGDALGAILGVVDRVAGAIGGLFEKAASAGGAIKGFIGLSAYNVPAVVAPPPGMPFYMTAASPTFGSYRVSAGGGRTSINHTTINVSGALDPYGTARAIRGVLRKDDRRDGRTTVGGGLW